MDAVKKKDNKKPQYTASVLLVEDVINKESDLKQALLDFNYYICEQIGTTDKLLEKREQCNPDVLIMRTNAPTANTLKELAEINQLSPLPILIFAEQDTPSLIQRSIKAGVSAYVVNEIQPQRLRSLIIVACERFKERQSLRNELEHTKAQLESRKLVERAKGYIMQQKKVTEQVAFNMLRKMSMDNGHSLAIVSKNVIEVYELLSPSDI